MFVGRNSSGVRGIKLMDGDAVISMSILKHSDATTEERDEYLRLSSALKKSDMPKEGEFDEAQAFNALEPQISYDLFKEMRDNEQFILSVTSTGYGKRTSAYEYRITARGGQGVANMEMSERNKEVVSSFPIKDDDQIMMVTDGGKLIRMPVEDIRIAGRKTQGVILFRTADDERVVSVTWLDADDDSGDDLEEEEAVVEEFGGVGADD